MKALILVAAMVVAGCATSTRTASDDAAAVARRVDAICALPAGEREAALEKLKEETGFVAYCGAD